MYLMHESICTLMRLYMYMYVMHVHNCVLHHLYTGASLWLHLYDLATLLHTIIY